MPIPRIRNKSGTRCAAFRLPSIFNTSPYMCSKPSNCDRICRMPCVLSVSESLIDCVVPHVPPSNDSRSSERVVFDVRSLSSPNTMMKRGEIIMQLWRTKGANKCSRCLLRTACSCFFPENFCGPFAYEQPDKRSSLRLVLFLSHEIHGLIVFLNYNRGWTTLFIERRTGPSGPRWSDCRYTTPRTIIAVCTIFLFRKLFCCFR